MEYIEEVKRLYSVMQGKTYSLLGCPYSYLTPTIKERYEACLVLHVEMWNEIHEDALLGIKLIKSDTKVYRALKKLRDDGTSYLISMGCFLCEYHMVSKYAHCTSSPCELDCYHDSSPFGVYSLFISSNQRKMIKATWEILTYDEEK